MDIFLGHNEDNFLKFLLGIPGRILVPPVTLNFLGQKVFLSV